MDQMSWDSLGYLCSKYQRFQWWCLTSQGSPAVMQHESVEYSSLILMVSSDLFYRYDSLTSQHGVQRRMISVDNFFVFLTLLFFAVLLL